jgi:hypothetical protein
VTSARIRRTLLSALAVSLCVAATTGIVAILTGDFDETEGRVLLTSLGFAVFSATTAPGASLRLRQSAGLRALGAVTIAASVASFVLLAIGIWTDPDDETLWRSFACAALVAFASSHASLVSAARRPTDGPNIGALCTVSIALGVADALFGILAASGAVDDVDSGFVELIAVTVILLVLTTALQPIARRIAAQRPATQQGRPADSRKPPAPAQPARPRAPQPLATEVLAAADRIDALNADPGNRAADIRREVERLRELARNYSG